MNTSTTSESRGLLALEGLSAGSLTALLDRAEAHRAVAAGDRGNLDVARGRIVANLFFEDSTRTRGSFTVAAQRLGATCLDLASAGSSLAKGETLVDTALNVEAMGVNALVVRTKEAGGPALIARHVRVPVINGGDGAHEHPTQGLLDILTLRQRLGTLGGRRVAIVGDIAHSRVARSNVHGLTTLGADVLLVGPAPLAPETLEGILPERDGDPAPRGTVRVVRDLDAILPEVDAIMMLRIQFERGSGISSDYRDRYALTDARAARLRDGVPVMHPGPMNRGLEIDSAVADCPERSVIMAQVTNGVAVRMGVLEEGLGLQA
jgi:aspartate carbamoyltransferase catalytic subunit